MHRINDVKKRKKQTNEGIRFMCELKQQMHVNTYMQLQNNTIE